MIKYKMFWVVPLTAKTPLETQVNDWLKDRPKIKIISTDMYGSTSSHGIVNLIIYTIMYEEIDN